MREGGGAVGRDDDALARREPVGLDDVGGAVGVDRGLDLGAGGRAGGTSGRDARGIHDPLRERLRPLELRGRLARAEHRDAARPQGVGDARDQRRLGTDDHEVDPGVVRVAGDGGGVVRVEPRDRGRVGGDAGVAGSDEQLVAGVLALQREEEGVLTGTGTEDEDAHAPSLPTGSRRGRAVPVPCVGLAGRT